MAKKSKSESTGPKAPAPPAAATETAGKGEAPVRGSLPLFYSRPEALTADRHANLGLKKDSGFAYSASTNSVPLNLVEFVAAMKSYPIVFVGEEAVTPVALLGIRTAQNLFVDGDGLWEADCYVPAYVRRYPFIFSDIPGREGFALCVDRGAASVVEEGGDPFFADGQPTELVDRALEFCRAYQQHHNATQELCREIIANDLLADRQATVALRSGERLSLGNFKVIDEQKFNALADETFLEWRRKGLVPAVYWHLASLANWNTLAARGNKEKAEAA